MSENKLARQMQATFDDLPIAKRHGQSVGQGFYIYNGACVVDIAEHLEARGIEKTPENAQAAFAELREYFNKRGKPAIAATRDEVIGASHPNPTGTTCPHCAGRMDVSTNPGGLDAPVEGNFCMCILCGKFSVYLADGKLRKATEHEESEILEHADNAEQVKALRQQLRSRR